MKRNDTIKGFTRDNFIDDKKISADIRIQMVFRYTIIGFAVLFLFLFRKDLPFPYPHLFLVAAATLVCNSLLHLLALKRSWRTIIHGLFPYIDALSAGPVFLFTGGFLSPFVITNVASNIGSAIIHTQNRNLALHTSIILFSSYLSVAVAQKAGVVPFYVGYVRTAMDNDFFFSFVIMIISLVIIASYTLIKALNFRVHQMLDEVSAGFSNVIAGTSPVAGTDFFIHLAKSCAQTLHVDTVILGELTDKSRSLRILAKAGIDGSVESGQLLPAGGSLFGEIIERGQVSLENGARREEAPQWLTVGGDQWSLFGTALRDAVGNPIGIFCLVNNGPIPRRYLVEPIVTVFTSRAAAELERKIAEDRQKQTEYQLAQAHKMGALGQLAGGIAHDFNNMLGVIIGHGGMVFGKLDESSLLRSNVEKILKAATSARDLIGSLSRFVHKEKPLTAKLDVNETVNETAALLDSTIVKNIRIVKNLGADPSCVMGDRSLLQNVLMNLAINARDAMEGRRGSITITSGNYELKADHPLCATFQIEPGDYVTIEVADTGSGMSKDTISHLFEPFFTTKPKGKGTGLGLANVWGYIENYKGAIEVKSEEGAGSSFVLYLRCHRVQKAETRAADTV